MTYLGEYYYLNSSCIRKSIALMFMSSSRDKFSLSLQNSVTDVSIYFRPPCWCPSGWAPAWRIHKNFFKYISPDISYMKNCTGLNLGKGLCIFNSFYSQILDFIYWTVLIFILIYFKWRATKNQQYDRQIHPFSF